MAANIMMDMLRQMQRDLAEQKDYMKNLHAIHKNINEKFNLMEGKLDQHQAIMEKLEEQVRKNNTLLFGSNALAIETKDETSSYTEVNDSNGGAYQSDIFLENNEANHLQTLNNDASLEQTKQENNKNDVQNSYSKGNPRRSITNEMREMKELFADFVKSGKTFFEETSSVGREQAPSQTYFSLEQNSQLKDELKQMMSDEISDVKKYIKEMSEKNNQAGKESIPTNAAKVEQLHNPPPPSIIPDYATANVALGSALATDPKLEQTSPFRQLETVEIPSFASYRDIKELNDELKKITENYQDSNSFPDIKVVPNTSISEHPVMKVLLRGVIATSLGNNEKIVIDISKRGLYTTIWNQLRNNPEMTMKEVLESHWERFHQRHMSGFRFYSYAPL